MSSRFPHLRPTVVSLSLLLMASIAAVGATPSGVERVSLSPTEIEGDGESFGPISLSGDGRFVAFASEASNFYGDRNNPDSLTDDNGVSDIFVRDRLTGFTEMVSVSNDVFGVGNYFSNGESTTPSISADGRWVAFQSEATNLDLLGADANNAPDVYLRDRRGNALMVSSLGNAESRNPSVSGDGRFVAFETDATNLATADANASPDILLAEIQFDTVFNRLDVVNIQRMTTDASGSEANQGGRFPSITADGRYVAFQSTSSNLGAGNGRSNIYVKDRLNGSLELISVNDDDVPGNNDSMLASISPDGRFVAFVSQADNLVEGDLNGSADIFVRDRTLGTTERVSVTSDGDEGDADSGIVDDPTRGAPGLQGRPSISSNGRFVTFVSDASNLGFDDNNLMSDIFVHDRTLLTTDRVSVNEAEEEGDEASDSAVISSDGNVVAYQSASTNLVEEDNNTVGDIFAVVIGSGVVGNEAPEIFVGPDQQVVENQVVTLDASESFDPDGDVLTFRWTQVDGLTEVTLNNPTSATPTFTAPLVQTFDTLIFQVEVSDGVNPAEVAEVFVDVNAAPPGTVTGSVRDAFGNPLVGALVQAFRVDGEEASATTNGAGLYTLTNVRVGQNSLTVSSPSFEPEIRTVSMPSGGVLLQDFTLSTRAASLEGTILLANGRPLVGATVSLLSGEGEVVGSDDTDSTGTYRITNLDRFTVASAAIIQITHPTVTEWSISNVTLTASRINQRSFQYGNLQVVVRAKPNQLRSRLRGTLVEVLIGETVVASNTVGRNAVLNFPNTPATTVRVRASNPRLTGSVVETTVPPGNRPQRVTLTMRRRGIF